MHPSPVSRRRVLLRALLAAMAGGFVAAAAHAAPPTITCPGPQATYENGGVYFFIGYGDPDGDPVVVSVVNPPRRAAFDPESGTFTWVPDFTQAGSYSVVFRAVAGGQTTECTVPISVANFNRLPRITCPAPIAVQAGDTLRAQATATDIDGDVLTFSSSALPSGATLSSSGAFVWVTGGVEPGTRTIPISVNDGTNSVSCSFQATVAPAGEDGRPILTCPGTLDRQELEPIDFEIAAFDPQGLPLTYSAAALPPGSSFDATTHRFLWTPSASQSGTWLPRFAVTNQISPPVECTVTIRVANVTPPVISCPAPMTVPERVPVAFAIEASGPAGYPITFTAQDLPRGSSFDPANQRFTWIPGFDQSGTYTPRFTATNGLGSSSCDVPITVEDRPLSPPDILCPPPPFTAVLRSVGFRVSASDPEQDAITLSARSLPAGASFAPHTGDFAWTPAVGEGGFHVVEFIASDGEGRDSCRVTIEVIDPGFAPDPHQPLLAGVRDVPADQGGWVRLRVVTPASDATGVPAPTVVGYNVWRRIALPGQAVVAPGNAELAGAAAAAALPPGTWESVGFTPAIQSRSLLLLAPTRADSSAAGNAREVYAVTSHLDAPASWTSSPADSGWSVDNLAPAAPSGRVELRADGPAVVSWNRSADLDLAEYAVHADATPGFEPGPANLRGSTTDTTWVDDAPPAGAWYRIVARDVHGNASVSPGIAVPRPGPGLPAEVRLAAPRPSPSRGDVEFAFELPAEGAIALSVVDVRGRRILLRASGRFPAGPHRLAWDGLDDRGRRVPAGVYSIRLEAAGRVTSRKFVRL